MHAEHGVHIWRTSTPASMQMAQPSASPTVLAAPHSHALVAASCTACKQRDISPRQLSQVRYQQQVMAVHTSWCSMVQGRSVPAKVK